MRDVTLSLWGCWRCHPDFRNGASLGHTDGLVLFGIHLSARGYEDLVRLEVRVNDECDRNFKT
jgi:hypothetical protein